jgi:hypothetical protein
MDRDHRNPKLAGGLDGIGHGVRYLMKFEIEEDLFACRHQFSNDLRPGLCEQLKADLVVIGFGAEPIDQCQGLSRGREVKRDDDW